MPARSGRILELDALRGLAAVAVVLFHYTTRYDQLFGHATSLGFQMPDGHFGVDLFFMLSGFVILMTLERTSSSVKFAWGRFSRLYPSYWAAAAITFAVVSICGLPGQQVTPAEAIINATMLQALLNTPHIDGAYWSLQAELIFYVNMLLLFRLGAFRNVGLTVIVWVTVANALHQFHPIAETSWPIIGSIVGKFTTVACLEYIPLFGIGVLFYQWHRNSELQMLERVGLASCFVAISLMDNTKAAIVDASLATLLWMAIHGKAKWLGGKPLLWLGAISYTLYLVHQNIGYVIIRHLESFGTPSILAITVAIATSLLLAHALHRLVERPSMQMLRNVRSTCSLPAFDRNSTSATSRL